MYSFNNHTSPFRSHLSIQTTPLHSDHTSPFRPHLSIQTTPFYSSLFTDMLFQMPSIFFIVPILKPLMVAWANIFSVYSK